MNATQVSTAADATVPWWLNDISGLSFGAETLKVGRSNHKLLKSFGHHLLKFAEIQQPLLKRLQRDAELESLVSWLPAKFSPLSSEGYFFCGFAWHDEKLTALQLQETPIAVHAVWHESLQNAEALALTEFNLNPAIVWSGLLRLPALKQEWMLHLRSSVWNSLLETLAPSWLLVDAPLPAGASLAGTSIVDWREDFPLSEHSHYQVLHAQSSLDWALNANPPLWPVLGSTEQVLVQLPKRPEAWILALYQTKQGRTEYVSALHAPTNHWQLGNVEV